MSTTDIEDLVAKVEAARSKVKDERNKPEAKVILDSISVFGVRLTTFELTIWRPMLSEFNTHRDFSRNSESSRAVPFPRKMAKLLEYPAKPVAWLGEKPGMQADEEIDHPMLADIVWQEACDAAVEHAYRLAALGVHKSLVNRLLEPFMWHTILVTATAYQNYERQRVSPMAQKEIEVPSRMLAELRANSQPTQELKPGEYHTPLIRVEDVEEAWECYADYGFEGDPDTATTEMLKQISVARCARVSLVNHDGVRDLGDDLKLWHRLTTEQLAANNPMHASPLEHVATPDPYNVQEIPIPTGEIIELPKYGNFLGWKQVRHEVEWSHGIKSYT